MYEQSCEWHIEKGKHGRHKRKDWLLEHIIHPSEAQIEIEIKFYRNTSSQTKEPASNNEMKFQNLQ